MNPFAALPNLLILPFLTDIAHQLLSNVCSLFPLVKMRANPLQILTSPLQISFVHETPGGHVFNDFLCEIAIKLKKERMLSGNTLNFFFFSMNPFAALPNLVSLSFKSY
jgi:hypothetical protein